MRKPILGEITCIRVPYHAPLRRFVEKQIQTWLEQHYPAQAGKDFQGVSYDVTFRRQGGGAGQGAFHGVECTLALGVGDECWEAEETASGPHQALLACLKRVTLSRRAEVASRAMLTQWGYFVAQTS